MARRDYFVYPIKVTTETSLNEHCRISLYANAKKVYEFMMPINNHPHMYYYCGPKSISKSMSQQTIRKISNYSSIVIESGIKGS